VNAKGIQPTFEKVQAIHEAPTPTTVTELQAFLGSSQFLWVFPEKQIRCASATAQSATKDVPWNWTSVHERAYKEAKELLQKDDLLVHYDEKMPLLLSCDSSSYGLGAVFSHELPNGKEAPIAYFSRSLSKAEKNYSQTDKEALAIVAAVTKFHQYLFGRKFKVVRS